MSPVVKYTLGRIGLFVLVVLVLLPFRLNVFITLMIALLVSMALAYVLLRKWRDEFAAQIAEGARRRREQKERLRSELAGEEPPAQEDDADHSARDTDRESNGTDARR